MPEFIRRLRTQQIFLLLLLAVLLGFSVLGGFSLLVLGLAGVDLLWGIREPEAWRYLSTLSVLTLIVLLGGLIYLGVHRPRVLDLARLVEERHPELKESLSTAVEIHQVRGGPEGQLQEALFRQVEAATAPLNFRRSTLPARLHPLLGLLIVVGAIVLSEVAGGTALVEKARYHRIDQLQGEATGLTVRPGSMDVPRDAEVAVQVKVNRWEVDPEIHFDEGGQWKRYPMNLREGGEASFTFYGLAETTRYRITTRSLVSDWYTLTVYDPPEIDALEIEITPPAYTREEPGSFSRLVDLFVPEGSGIRFEVQSGSASEATLRLSGEDRLMERDGDGVFRTAWRADQSGDFQVILDNAEGRRAVSDRRRLKVIPDRPPVVDILEPGRDTEANPRGVVPLTVYAADDYGISRVEVHLSVSGLPRRPLVIYEAGELAQREIERLSALEMVGLGTEHGDVVTYYAVAWDNREPEPQTTRSEVFFVEVKKEVPEQEGLEGQPPGDGDQPPEEIDLRAIIVEVKRVIRETHRAERLTGFELEQHLQGLGAALAEVKEEGRQIFSLVAPVLIQLEGGMIFETFRNALVRLDEAERLLNIGQPGEALPPLGEALSNLVLVESYLRSLPQEPGDSGGGEGEPSSTAAGEGEQDQSPPERDGTSIKEMQAMLEDLNRLVDQQSGQNADYRRSEGQSLSAAEREELRNSQLGIESAARQVRDGLRQLPESRGMRQTLDEARGNMRGAAEAATAEQMEQAGRGGMRARESLLQAASLLEERIREVAAASLNALAEEAGRLAEGQRGAEGQSQSAAAGQGGDAPGMRADQEGLRQGYEALLGRMDREASDLEGLYPEVAEALSNVVRDANRVNTPADMQRASNALLYERFDRAATSQGRAAQQLEELSSAMQGVMQAMPGISPSELQRLLAEVNRAREAEGGTPGGTRGESPPLGQLGGRLEKTGRVLGNQDLIQLGQHLEATAAGAEAGEGTAAGLTPQLDQAAQILRQLLRATWTQERFRLNQEVAPPPEKYRRLVEEYFKQLAE